MTAIKGGGLKPALPSVTRTASARSTVPRGIFFRAADRNRTCFYGNRLVPRRRAQ